jgi:hypothetical protein
MLNPATQKRRSYFGPCSSITKSWLCWLEKAGAYANNDIKIFIGFTQASMLPNTNYEVFKYPATEGEEKEIVEQFHRHGFVVVTVLDEEEVRPY